MHFLDFALVICSLRIQLLYCRVVEQLSLIGCGISPVGVEHISDTLCNAVLTCNITKLNLSDNENVS